jgi:hypothetical protein
VSFEWKAGAIFAIPLNASHQHFNASGRSRRASSRSPTRPAIINAFGDLDFVFGTSYDFRDRFDGSARLLRRQGRAEGPAAGHQLRGRRRSTCR